MASGVDDDVTLRANREGFLKFQLRPRRLVDVSKVDMSTEILGQKIRDADHHRPDRRTQSLSSGRRGRRRAGRQDRRSPDDPLHPGDDIGRRRDRRARPADLVAALCHQQIRSRQAPRREHGTAGLDRGRRHRRPQRRPQSGDGVAHGENGHATMLGVPRPFQPRGFDARRSDVRRRRSQSGSRTSNRRR